MLVKLLVQVGTDEIVGNVGEVVEVNDSDARFMIRAGYCVSAEPIAEVAPDEPVDVV